MIQGSFAIVKEARGGENAAVTIPNIITIARLILIPVFVVFACLYSNRLSSGETALYYRWVALIVFVVAALSDAVDGYIARHYHQDSPLGRALDPVADKLLMLAGILTLSLTNWTPPLPVWFAILVVTRDVLIVLTVIFLHFRNGAVVISPVKSSKWCTLFEFSCIGWALLDFRSVERPLILEILVGAATALCLFSAVQYLQEGVRQLREGPAEPVKSPSDP